MNPRLALLALPIAIAMAYPAIAEEDGFGKMVREATTDERVSSSVDFMLRNIDKMKCGKVKCEMTTAAELANPPLSIDQARQAMKKGMASAMVDWCGGNWQDRVLAPMLIEAKFKAGLNERQIALLMGLHGTQHVPLKKILESKGPCPEKLKEQVTQKTFLDPGTEGFDPKAPVPGLVDTPGRDGETSETALVINSPRGSAGAVQAELIWIGRKHPGARKTSQALLGVNGRQIDRIDGKLQDGTEKSYFFDITDAFGLPR